MTVQLTEPLHRHLEVAALLRGGSEQPAREQLARFGEAVGDSALGTTPVPRSAR